MNLQILKKSHLILTVSTIVFSVVACNSGNDSEKTVRETNSAKEWFETKEWLHGLDLKPHESINKEAFQKQFEKDSTYWTEAFNYLKTTDLDNLPPGQYNIDSGNVYAVVMLAPPKEKDSVKWEGHMQFDDLQYIARGKAEMGVVSRNDPTVKVTMPYDSTKDLENFVAEDGKYYTGEPGTFFIFTPSELHRPGIKMEGVDTIKRIVVKVRVP